MCGVDENQKVRRLKTKKLPKQKDIKEDKAEALSIIQPIIQPVSQNDEVFKKNRSKKCQILDKSEN